MNSENKTKVFDKKMNQRISLMIAYFEKGRQSDFADNCSIGRPTLSQIVNCKQEIRTTHLQNIAKKYPVNTRWLLLGEGEMLIDEKNPALTKRINTLEERVNKLENIIE